MGGADVIFSEEGDSILLGTFTLEALGLVLDPPAAGIKTTAHGSCCFVEIIKG